MLRTDAEWIASRGSGGEAVHDDAGYQLSYLYGKRMLLDLKKWASKKMGKRFTDRFFHDAVLAAGSLPIALMRRELEWRMKAAREASK